MLDIPIDFLALPIDRLLPIWLLRVQPTGERDPSGNGQGLGGLQNTVFIDYFLLPCILGKTGYYGSLKNLDTKAYT